MALSITIVATVKPATEVGSAGIATDNVAEDAATCDANVFVTLTLYLAPATPVIKPSVSVTSAEYEPATAAAAVTTFADTVIATPGLIVQVSALSAFTIVAPATPKSDFELVKSPVESTFGNSVVLIVDWLNEPLAPAAVPPWIVAVIV